MHAKVSLVLAAFALVLFLGGVVGQLPVASSDAYVPPLTHYNCIPYGDRSYWTDYDRACLPLPSPRPPGVIDRHWD